MIIFTIKLEPFDRLLPYVERKRVIGSRTNQNSNSEWDCLFLRFSRKCDADFLENLLYGGEKYRNGLLID